MNADVIEPMAYEFRPYRRALVRSASEVLLVALAVHAVGFRAGPFTAVLRLVLCWYAARKLRSLGQGTWVGASDGDAIGRAITLSIVAWATVLSLR